MGPCIPRTVHQGRREFQSSRCSRHPHVWHRSRRRSECEQFGLWVASLPESVAVKYDHKIFPGAVPRTFIGSLFLAWTSTPIIKTAATLGLIDSKSDLQMIGRSYAAPWPPSSSQQSLSLVVRLVLATINAFGLILVRRAVSRWLGGSTGFLWTLLTCTQSHLPFWMSRTLPNMFALFPGTCPRLPSTTTY